MNKMRQEFERAVVDGVIISNLFGHEFSKSIRKIQVSDCFTCGKYQNDVLQLSWEAWQASRSTLRVELPDAWILAEHEYKRRVEESLDSAGVSYE